MTGVSECSQQRGSLKDDGYKGISLYYHAIYWLIYSLHFLNHCFVGCFH
ncbi:hypothetical protein [Photorhabdus bodei]|uniref:Uncharacterized protein n=1 Tax=Photorhabdus bodei TaxID=2029681 RepID=A0AAW6BDP4_9GAMM|nr:hypothetical protein [Photorhabdus bodei]MCC8466008.1 hypothetical protein [Photorhabdus bodei]MDB6370653.1 hypothetical protein [Photorhabdus bodei]